MNEPNTQLVRLSPGMNLDTQVVPQEAADVREEMPEEIGVGEISESSCKDSQSNTDHSDREYLLRMYFEIHRMKCCEILVYIVAVFVAISSVLTPFVVTRYLPPPGRATSITVTSNGVSSITTTGGTYTVIVTSGDGGNISVVTTGGSTSADANQKNAERKARQERKVAERESKRKAKEAKRLDKQAAKLEKQAEKLRQKAERLK